MPTLPTSFQPANSAGTPLVAAHLHSPRRCDLQIYIGCALLRMSGCGRGVGSEFDVLNCAMWPQVPRFGTEGVFTASVIGCTYYIVVALIWSIIFYVGLDPIKWLMAYILNEDGFRDIKVLFTP